MKKRHWIFILFICGLLGCQPQLMWWKQLPDSYQSILSHWTQSGQVYHGLKTVFTVSATYVHMDTRRRYVRQYSEDHNFSEAQEKELLAQEEAQAAKGHEFIVGSFSDEDDWMQLESANSVWEISFINDKGLRVKPQQIEYFKEVPIYIKTYYPFVTAWKNIYRITFPVSVNNTPLLDDQTRHFDLDFLGAVAQVKLQWTYRQP